MRFFSSALLLAVAVSAADKGRPSLKNAAYKNPKASVDARVADLLSRMTIDEKASQLLQGDIRNWMNETTGALNQTGLEWSTRARGSSFYVGVAVPNAWISEHIKAAQDYIQNETYLGIPAFVQTEGLHGFLARMLLGVADAEALLTVTGRQCHHLQLADRTRVLLEPGLG
jgi:beta-glucosidase